MQRRRADGGHADRGHGAGAFKQQVEEAPLVLLEDGNDHRSRQQHTQADEQNGQGLPHQVDGQTALHHGHVVLTANDAQHQQKQHAHGGGFHAAARGGGGRADEHQNDRPQLGGFPHGPKVNGVEARRAHGHGLEKSVQQLVAEGHAFQRGRIASFQQQEAQRADDQQPQRYGQYQLGVQGQAAEIAVTMDALKHHRKAQSAQ